MMRSSVDSEQAWIQGLITDLANVQIEGRDEAKFRAVFISDIHLGTMGCQAVPLLEFLKVHTSDYLYLVGDIIDGWQIRRKWYWPQTHNDVVQKLLRSARKGCRVIFVPGNHDEFARGFIGHRFGGQWQNFMGYTWRLF